MQYGLIFLATAFLLFVPLLGQAAPPSPIAVTLSSEEKAANVKAIAFLKAKRKSLQIPGLQVTVVHQGRIILTEAFGLANIEHQVPTKRNTLFPINSATKSFTGVAI